MAFMTRLFNTSKGNSQPEDDLGLGSKYGAQGRRLVNPDGSFNIERKHTSKSLYHYLINISWTAFSLWILAFYLLLNLAFALVYLLLGLDQINAFDTDNALHDLLLAFSFSVQTMTTVGYGDMHPTGVGAMFISALEALLGLLSFAIASGLMYGRFSRPTAKIAFSRAAIIAPYKGITSFQIRVANQRRNMMIDIEARVLLSIKLADGNRQFHRLALERDQVHFLPLSWTIVHPIDDDSPLKGLDSNDLKEADAEFLVLLNGYDDTFAHQVHTLRSYKFGDIDWDKKFEMAYYTDKKGITIFDLDHIDSTLPANTTLSEL